MSDKEKKNKKVDEEQEIKTEEENVLNEEIVTIEKFIKDNDELTKKCADLEDRYLRVVAEYDNYRKRSIKERESIYADAYGEALTEILPIIDNLERAVQFTDSEKVVDGLKLTLNQCENMLAKLGIEPIAEFGEGVKFDPVYHNAVMHVEDENAGDNEVAEIFQKGYKKGEKVIRYAMVKVVN
jgi:Molecular chaperone GrpE (heat shock protein)